MIDLRYVKKLIEMIDESSVDSIEIASEKGVKIRISKTPTQRGVSMAAPVAMPQVMTQAMLDSRYTPPSGSPTMAPSDGAAAATPVSASGGMLEVKSPMVGTFYSAPDPNSPDYVSVGSRVSKGQIVCIIEAMKIMNEIECEYDGVVREIVAENAHPVEYGQVLFRIDPNG